MASYIIPKPEGGEQFQQFCLKLFSELWQTDSLQQYGHSGDAQHGVDIFDFDLDTLERRGIQCKCVKTLEPKDIEREICLAKGFPMSLDKYYIATTIDRKVSLQDKVLEANKNPDIPFSVILYTWDDILDLLNTQAHKTQEWWLGEVGISNTKLDAIVARQERILAHQERESQTKQQLLSVKIRVIQTSLGNIFAHLKTIYDLTRSNKEFLSNKIFDPTITRVGKVFLLMNPNNNLFEKISEEGKRAYNALKECESLNPEFFQRELASFYHDFDSAFPDGNIVWGTPSPNLTIYNVFAKVYSLYQRHKNIANIVLS